MGFNAATTLTTGDSNVVIGYEADVSIVGANNQIVIGSRAIGRGDNTVVLGDSSITKVYMSFDGGAVIYANGTINTSDLRLKKDINNIVLGLKFIKQLRPVTYRWKKDKENVNKLHHGLIAQEIDSILQTHNMSKEIYSLVNYDEVSDKYGINYSEVTVPLIKAVQELSEENNTLKEKNTNLENRVSELETQLAAIKAHLGI